MKYIVYLTTNKKSKIDGKNKIYIGVHQTNNPDIFDGYIGCGVYIDQPSTYMYPKTPFQCAVKKYGVDAFEREILYIYNTEKEAYKKEEELVDIDFLKQSHTYNACLGGSYYNNYKPLYQFDFDGNLKRKWDFSKEAYDFYNIPMEKFEYALHGCHPLLDSFWSREETIDISLYSKKTWGAPKVTHLYSKAGKWLGEFISRKACGDFIGINEEVIVKAIQQQSLVHKEYYVSDKLMDEFKPKARVQYAKMTFHLYKEEPFEYIGEFVGKEIMKIIDMYSWEYIRDCMRYNKGWCKDFYISLEKIDELPVRGFGIHVDVFDKWGNYIETLDTIKEVREKYKVPSAKIKNIQFGDRYYKDWIFKYHSKRIVNDIV